MCSGLPGAGKSNALGGVTAMRCHNLRQLQATSNLVHRFKVLFGAWGLSVLGGAGFGCL